MRSDKGKKTEIFGLIGFPVKHTLSPHFQNAAFASLGMDAVYIPFEVAPEKLGEAMRSIKALGIKGINVTIPHKQAVLEFVDILSPEVRGIGAANTVVFKDGKSRAYNTDGPGFIHSLKYDLGLDPKGMSVLLFGCGGAARSIAYMLAKKGAKSIVFTDIDTERAKQLCGKTSSDFPRCRTGYFPSGREFVDAQLRDRDLLVNTTPVGMHKGDLCMVSPEALHSGLSVYDIVYNRPTPLVMEAARKGLNVANGIGMLLYQGVLAFECFTGRKAPVEVMRKALMKAIGKCLTS